MGIRDCNECGDREGCQIGTYCNCYSDCYDYGDCCPDVSYVKNCVGKHFNEIVLFLYTSLVCLCSNSCTFCTVEECESGSVRLVGGSSNSTGLLEVCANGRWGRVCNRPSYWSAANAQVVCRQLGFHVHGKN